MCRDLSGNRKIMGRECAAHGCNSGYDNNSKKLHVFLVPKEPKEIERWQKAILRDDIKLKYGHIVYDKHFFPEDII